MKGAVSARLLCGVLLTTLLAAIGCGGGGGDRDYLLAPHRPNLLAVIDAKKREVVRVHELSGGPPFTLVASEDGQVAYVIVGPNRRLTGVDIASGEDVFRADLGGGTERVSAPGANLRPHSWMNSSGLRKSRAAIRKHYLK